MQDQDREVIEAYAAAHCARKPFEDTINALKAKVKDALRRRGQQLVELDGKTAVLDLGDRTEQQFLDVDKAKLIVKPALLLRLCEIDGKKLQQAADLGLITPEQAKALTIEPKRSSVIYVRYRPA